MEEKGLRILDIGPVQAVYADDIAHVEVVGPNVRITFCERRRVMGELVRVPIFELIRPLTCDLAEKYFRLLSEQMALRVQEQLAMH